MEEDVKFEDPSDLLSFFLEDNSREISMQTEDTEAPPSQLSVSPLQFTNTLASDELIAFGDGYGVLCFNDDYPLSISSVPPSTNVPTLISSTNNTPSPTQVPPTRRALSPQKIDTTPPQPIALSPQNRDKTPPSKRKKKRKEKNTEGEVTNGSYNTETGVPLASASNQDHLLTDFGIVTLDGKTSCSICNKNLAIRTFYTHVVSCNHLKLMRLKIQTLTLSANMKLQLFRFLQKTIYSKDLTPGQHDAIDDILPLVEVKPTIKSTDVFHQGYTVCEALDYVFHEISKLKNRPAIFPDPTEGDIAYWHMCAELETFNLGDVVALQNGVITKNTTNAQLLFAIPSSPWVKLHQPTSTKGYQLLGYMGQIDINVVDAQASDYIIPSGNHDGLGKAVSPENMTLELVGKVVGVAISPSTPEGKASCLCNFDPTVVTLVKQLTEGLEKIANEHRKQVRNFRILLLLAVLFIGLGFYVTAMPTERTITSNTNIDLYQLFSQLGMEPIWRTRRSLFKFTNALYDEHLLKHGRKFNPDTHFLNMTTDKYFLQDIYLSDDELLFRKMHVPYVRTQYTPSATIAKLVAPLNMTLPQKSLELHFREATVNKRMLARQNKIRSSEVEDSTWYSFHVSSFHPYSVYVFPKALPILYFVYPLQLHPSVRGVHVVVFQVKMTKSEVAVKYLGMQVNARTGNGYNQGNESNVLSITRFNSIVVLMGSEWSTQELSKKGNWEISNDEGELTLINPPRVSPMVHEGWILLGNYLDFSSLHFGAEVLHGELNTTKQCKGYHETIEYISEIDFRVHNFGPEVTLLHSFPEKYSNIEIHTIKVESRFNLYWHPYYTSLDTSPIQTHPYTLWTGNGETHPNKRLYYVTGYQQSNGTTTDEPKYSAPHLGQCMPDYKFSVTGFTPIGGNKFGLCG